MPRRREILTKKERCHRLSLRGFAEVVKSPSELSVPQYSEAKLRDALEQLRGLLLAPEQTRDVPRLLSECGVRYVIVEKLPNSKIDGVCFWMDTHPPVIGMSIQRDTIDNFWFVLRHEIEHVLRKHGMGQEKIDGDCSKSEEGSAGRSRRSALRMQRREISRYRQFESFMIRKKPFYYERDVIAYSRIINRHPGIIVGQMQRKLGNYSYLARHLAKVRQFVVPNAIVDGWGHSLAISL